MQVNNATQQPAYDPSFDPARKAPPQKPKRTPETATDARAGAAQNSSRGKDTPAGSPQGSQPAAGTSSSAGQPERPASPSSRSAAQSQASQTAMLRPGDTRATNHSRAARSPATPPATQTEPHTGPSPTFTIFGATAATPPSASYSLKEREHLAESYTGRVKTQMADIENGSEGERNVKFLNARPFMTPSGYFSGGLMAAGYDPNKEIRGEFSSYVGMGRPQSKTGSEERSYKAWEIAAGRLEHDRPEKGGTVNFKSLYIDKKDQALVNDFESLGKTLQDHWKQDVATPMQDPSGALAARSGKADAYSVRATLQALRDDPGAFGKLSPEGQQAMNRTLNESGQTIIPNIYGYPMAGHAFIPYQPYDGNYEHRPNQGLMVSPDRGAVSEIKGDEDFVDWARRNHDDVLQSFNARDRQGGLDAHWPKADDVLDNLIGNNQLTYPGAKNLVSDMPIPAGQMFNYTRARGGDYQLKYGNLNNGNEGGGVASEYQAVNAKNAAWSDQTQVFGQSQQNWKAAKEIWDKSFGYLPIVGNAGQIAFGINDSLNGMTAQDRAGGTMAATIAGLQLAHEWAPGVAESKFGPSPLMSSASGARGSAWQYNPKTAEFSFTQPAPSKSQPWFQPPQKLPDGRTGYPLGPTKPPGSPGSGTGSGSDASPEAGPAGARQPGTPGAPATPPAPGDVDSSNGSPPPAKRPRLDDSPQPGPSGTQVQRPGTPPSSGSSPLSSPASPTGRQQPSPLPDSPSGPDAFRDIEDLGPTELHDIQPAMPDLRPPHPDGISDAANALYRPANGENGVTSARILDAEGHEAGCLGLGMQVVRMAAYKPEKLDLLSASTLLYAGYAHGEASRAKVMSAINRIQTAEWEQTKYGGVPGGLGPREIAGYTRRPGYSTSNGQQLVDALKLGFNPQTNLHGESPRFAMLSYTFRDEALQAANVGHVGFVERSFKNPNYLDDAYTYYDSSKGGFSYANLGQLAYALQNYYGMAYEGLGGFDTTRSYFYTQQPPPGGAAP